MADAGHARRTAQRFVRALAANGTTSALVFGSHFPGAQQALFEEAEAAGLRIASGLVVSDRNLRRRPRGHARGRLRGRAATLRERWHGRGRLRYAVTPRFSSPAPRRCSTPAARCSTRRRPRCSPATSTRARARSTSSASCSRTRATTSAPTRTPACCASARCSPTTSTSPTTSCDRLARVAHRGRALPVVERVPGVRASSRWPATSSTACASGWAPTSAPAPGSRMLKEGLVAYHVQMVRDQGHMLGPAHLLYLATAAGAEALGLERPLRRPDARQGGRPRAAARRRGSDARGRCSRTRRRGRPRLGAQSSRSPARSRVRRGRASAATSCSAHEVALRPATK